MGKKGQWPAFVLLWTVVGLAPTSGAALPRTASADLMARKGLDDLPLELVQSVFQKLDPKDKVTLASSCSNICDYLFETKDIAVFSEAARGINEICQDQHWMPYVRRTLPRLRGVRTLRVIGIRLQPSDYESISQLRNLRTLKLSHCDLEHVGYLGDLKSLFVLDVSYNNLRDFGLEGLARLENLQGLHMVYNKIQSDRALAGALGSLSKLQTLSVGDEGLEGNFLTALSDREHPLRHLKLWFVRLTREGALALGELKELRFLQVHALAQWHYLALGLRQLRKLRVLKLGALPHHEVWPVLESLREARELKTLELGGVQSLSLEALRLVLGFQNLTKLTVPNMLDLNLEMQASGWQNTSPKPYQIFRFLIWSKSGDGLGTDPMQSYDFLQNSRG